MMAVTHPLVPIVNCKRKGDLQYPGHHQGRLTLAAAMRPKASKSTRRGYPQASTNRNGLGLEAIRANRRAAAGAVLSCGSCSPVSRLSAAILHAASRRTTARVPQQPP
jgi:hypothetical protein